MGYEPNKIAKGNLMLYINFQNYVKTGTYIIFVTNFLEKCFSAQYTNRNLRNRKTT